MIGASCSWSLRMGIGIFCMLSSVVLADTMQGGRAFQLSTQLSSDTQAEYEKDMYLAEKAFSGEDLIRAISLLRGAAEHNYIPAQVRLGEILDYAEEDSEAVGWYMMAANQGDAAGEHHLGIMYLIGEGIEIDIAKAVYWITLAAKQDYLAAVKALAQAYRFGEMGLAIDLEQAQFWDGRKIILEAALKSKATKIEAEKGTVQ